MPQLDIEQALGFLDMLDPNGRHTIASEAPFGGKDDSPRWMGGATYERERREDLIKDIRQRQARGWNVYYGVNRPCSFAKQQGSRGKCNKDDIIAIRALAFDIDVIKRPFDNALLLDFVDQQLVEARRPSLVIDSGGGFQLIYLLKEHINVQLFRPPPDLSPGEEDENEQINVNRSAIKTLADEFETLLCATIPFTLKEHIRIDNMSNLDRVMRLPGTINYPKAEKIARKQVPALAHIAKVYQVKCDIYALRKQVPRGPEAPPARTKSNVARLNKNWPNIRKIRIACEFIKDNVPEVDDNHWYTHNVMFPLISAIHDQVDPISVNDAFECFMEAVSGGIRCGSMGRGPTHFERQWKSHHPELPPRVISIRTLGTLFGVCQEHGMKLPWSDAVLWEDDFQRQLKELNELKQSFNQEDICNG